MCLAGQSYCESAEARERTALCEAVRFSLFIHFQAGLLTENLYIKSRWKGVVVERVGSNF